MNSRFKHYFETNKATWNAKTKFHTKSDFYDLDGFKNGKTSLNTYELDALGCVKGKSLLHLQCHFGQDTLSWSRLGAKCVGVDFSDEAIKTAKQLNTELSLEAEFVCCNVLEVSQHISQQFDIVFTSYGVIGWLPNLNIWASEIAKRLKSRGTFYMVEFHPIVWMFDYLKNPPEMCYAYNKKEAIYEEYEGTYADVNSKITSKEYGWNHGLGDVVTALTEAGLRLEFLKEHNKSPYNILPDLVETEDGFYVTKDKLYPLLFELKAVKI